MMKNKRLSKSFADAGCGIFLKLATYKANWRGKEVVQIGRFEPSSKMCSNCGAINNDLKLHHRLWRCKICNILHDRNINAAKNIKNIGQGMSKLTPVDYALAAKRKYLGLRVIIGRNRKLSILVKRGLWVLTSIQHIYQFKHLRCV